MDLKLSSEEQLFQQEIRTWFEKALPEGHLFRGGSIINMAREQMACLLYTSPSPRDYAASRMPSSA